MKVLAEAYSRSPSPFLVIVGLEPDDPVELHEAEMFGHADDTILIPFVHDGLRLRPIGWMPLGEFRAHARRGRV